jgi:hypothetical protein
MKELGKVKRFLGINVNLNDNDNVMTLDQSDSIINVAKKFNVENCRPIYTPIESNLSLEVNLDPNFNTKLPYKQLLGSLMYIALGTRPDIMFSISYFGMFQQNPKKEHFQHLLRVLMYLVTTKDLCLNYCKNDVILEAFADADWANSVVDRKSVSGYCLRVFGNIVSWTSKKQSLVALSTTEAEFIALCNAACDVIFLKNLLYDMNIVISNPIKIHEDNQSTIKIVRNFENNKRCKHIDVKYSFVFDLVKKNVIDIIYVDTNNQVADIFTKSLSRIKFENNLKMLKLS